MHEREIDYICINKSERKVDERGNIGGRVFDG